MAWRRRFPVLTFLVLAAVGALVLTGCSGDGGDETGTADQGPPSGTTGTGDPAETVTVTASPEPSGAGTGGEQESAAGEDACTVDDLSVTVRPAEGGGAAGSQYTEILLTNIADQVCTTGGFGGVSYVGGGSGTQVGEPAKRAKKGDVDTFTLRAGQTAVQLLREVRAENYDDAECDPESVDGLRIYPPNETRSLYAEHATTGCAAEDVTLLVVEPYHPA